MPNFCSNCGAKLDPKAKFCSNCGSPVAAVVAPAPVNAPAPAQNYAPVSTASIEELQTELYGLYKILEPVRELDLVSRAIDAKIAELSGPQKEAKATFRRDFIYYAPFIRNFIDENFISPSTKEDIKSWKAFVKRQKEKSDRKYNALEEGKYDLQDIFRLCKKNKAKFLKTLGVSFLYYKMAYCFEEPESPSKYWVVPVCDSNGKHPINSYRLINMDNFINRYLPKQLGDACDDYLIRVFKLGYDTNKGELQLHDITHGYAYAPSIEARNLRFYDESLGFPKISYIDRYPCNMWQICSEVRKRLEKSAPILKELNGAIAELSKMKDQIDGKIAEYMQEVDPYIDANVKIVPISYARNWETVSYFLHLVVNKRGRDIYEISNQYELDMKHMELTSALVDIRSEIGNQTRVLSGKLDNVNRTVVQMTDAITNAIYDQAEILYDGLEKINFSVISTGATVVNSISKMGASLAKALGSIEFKVNVST